MSKKNDVSNEELVAQLSGRWFSGLLIAGVLFCLAAMVLGLS